MKKKLLYIIILLFVFVPSVYAINVDNVTINAIIDDKGIANVEETWTTPSEINTKSLNKLFYSAKGIKISNIAVNDLEGDYTSVESLSSDANKNYAFIDSGFKKKIKFTTNGKENKYTIKYTVDGIISKFKDGYGINFFFYNSISGYNVNNLVINISSSGVEFSDQNTKIYANGNNINARFQGNTIVVEANSLSSSSKVSIVTLSNIEYSSFRESKYTAEEASKKNSSKLIIIDEMLAIATSGTSLVIIGIFGLIILLLIIRGIIKKVKGFDEYYEITTANGKSVPSINDVNYYDSIPCNGDLYKIAFIGGYYKIYKNRSNLVGALLLSWIYSGYIKVVNDSSGKCLKLADGVPIDRELDRDLYSILVDASSYYQLDSARLNRYASDHYMRVMTWFNMGFSNVITDEINRGRIIKDKKLKRITKVMNDEIYEDAVKIQGLKRYLLNFNQVPRQSELTPETYQYMLIIAELLGIGEAFAREILRKNPNNEMANQLLELEKLSFLYKSVYNYALTPYKQVVKSKKSISTFEPSDIINNVQENRQSKL